MYLHPDLIDCDNDRWTWKASKDGEEGYVCTRLLHPSRPIYGVESRAYVERRYGPVTEVSDTTPAEVSDTTPAAPEPRTFSLPKPPDDLHRVSPADNLTVTFTRNVDRWVSSTGYSLTWLALFNAYRPLVEVIETPYEAAVRRLKNTGFPYGDETWYDGRGGDVRIVVRHAIDAS